MVTEDLRKMTTVIWTCVKNGPRKNVIHTRVQGTRTRGRLRMHRIYMVKNDGTKRFNDEQTHEAGTRQKVVERLHEALSLLLKDR